MTERMDKQTLAAFVDGELDPEAATRVALHLADCPADRAYVDRIAADRALLARAYADIAEDPLPEGLRAVLGAADAERAAPRPGVVTALRPRRAPALWAGLAGLAAAAAVALVVGPRLWPGGGGPELAAGPAPADGRLAAALAEMTSGEVRELADGARLEMVASFPDGRGRLCREFVLRDAGRPEAEHAVACGSAEGWTVEIVVARPAPAGGEDAFLPAEGGAGAQAIDRLLDEIGAGLALTPEEEAAARARGWRP